MKLGQAGFAALLTLALWACGEPTKEDLIKKSANARVKSDLEKMLGAPDDIAKLGPIERWTYHSSNGEVVFIITGETIALQAAGAAGKTN